MSRRSRRYRNDIHRNLEAPLEGIRRELARSGFPDVAIRTLVRTGDTPPTSAPACAEARRTSSSPRPIALRAARLRSGRKMLATTRTVILDEIHAVAPNKRGAHLALSLERLSALCGERLQRIGLSATQKPIGDRELPGRRRRDGAPARCEIIDAGHLRARDFAIEIPDSPLEAVMSNEVWTAGLRTPRRADPRAPHDAGLRQHAADGRARRARADRPPRRGCGRHASRQHGQGAAPCREQRLKRGELKAMVATASLELGIDIGDVDLVCQIGSPRSIATFLQRVGRSGHAIDGTPKGRLFPLRATIWSNARRFSTASGAASSTALTLPDRRSTCSRSRSSPKSRRKTGRRWRCSIVCAAPGRTGICTRDEFDAVVKMLAEGFATRRGRRGTLIHRDAVHGVLRGRRAPD